MTRRLVGPAPHPLYSQLRRLRSLAGWTLNEVERRTSGRHKGVVVGSYERADRHPSVAQLDALLRDVYGHRLEIVPESLSDEHLELAAWLAAQGVTLVEAQAALNLIRAARAEVARPELRSVA